MNPIKISIPVPSKQVIFCNYFNGIPEAPNAHRSIVGEEEINNFAGRVNLAIYQAGRGVAYAQTGNCSLAIWFNDNTGEGLVVDALIDEDFDYNYKSNDPRHYATDGYQLYQKLVAEGFDKKGNVSCEMWRIEAADSQTEYTPCGDTVLLPVAANNINFEIYDRGGSFLRYRDSRASISANCFGTGRQNSYAEWFVFIGMAITQSRTGTTDRIDNFEILRNCLPDAYPQSFVFYTGEFSDVLDWSGGIYNAPRPETHPLFQELKQALFDVYRVNIHTTQNLVVRL